MTRSASNVDSSVAQRQSEQALVAAGANSYVHALSRSKFQIGANPRLVNEFGMSKNVGDNGVFAVLQNTQMALGLGNATAPEAARPPFTTDPNVAGQAAVKYFTAAGLPLDQIGDVLPYAAMNQTQAGSALPGPATLDHYTSVLTRRLAGVDVPDSIAYVHLNVDGAAVREAVYWPRINGTTIATAISLRDRFADSTGRASYVTALPSTLHNPRVAIRHTPGMSSQGWEEHAVVDFTDETQQTVHFDELGRRVVMADEVAGTTSGGGDHKP